jgi:antitoxin ParD1/3/4
MLIIAKKEMERERIYRGRFDELQKEIMIGVEELKRGEGVDGEIAMKQLRQEMIQLFRE